MIRNARLLLGATAATAFAMVGVGPSALAGGDGLAAHRAVYDLKLVQSRGKATIQAVRGRILYDFSGSSCEGYALQFRQVSELDTGEGRTAVSDLRSTTWEDGEAKSFRFNSQNFLNQELGDNVDGRAERRSDGVAVSLSKPRDKALTLDAATVFPSEHMRRILAAAREGKSILELPVYDGSETGEKIYNTLTVIGQAIAPDQRKPTDAAAGQAGLVGLKRWPVTISYFDRNTKGGEQTPVYAIAFETYENGISRALTLDYNDFVISGEMSALEIKDEKPCP
jgi:EipB-like